MAAALQKCKDRAAVNFTLAEKLNKLIGVHQRDPRLFIHSRQSFVNAVWDGYSLAHVLITTQNLHQ